MKAAVKKKKEKKDGSVEKSFTGQLDPLMHY